MYSLELDLITNATRQDIVRRDSDGALIPKDPGNADWTAYQAWLAAGHVPTDPRRAASKTPGSPSALPPVGPPSSARG